MLMFQPRSFIYDSMCWTKSWLFGALEVPRSFSLLTKIISMHWTRYHSLLQQNFRYQQVGCIWGPLNIPVFNFPVVGRGSFCAIYFNHRLYQAPQQIASLYKDLYAMVSK